MSDLSTLPPLERMKAYRAMAETCLKASQGLGSGPLQEHYLFIAAQWAELAQDLKLRLARDQDR